MKFIATKMGFFAGRRVRAGETFEAKDFKGSWADPVEAKVEAGEKSPAPVSPPKKKRKKTAKKSKASAG